MRDYEALTAGVDEINPKQVRAWVLQRGMGAEWLWRCNQCGAEEWLRDGGNPPSDCAICDGGETHSQNTGKGR